MRNVLSVASIILAIGAGIPYIFDIIARRTKPNIVTWFTWTLLTAVATAAAFSAHQPRSAVLTMATSFGTFLVVVLGLKYGIAKFSLFDGLCQAGVIVGLVLWFIFNSPLIAIVASVVIDFIGLLPTLRHSWIKPGEETWETFGIAFLAALLTVISIRTFSITGILFPAYLVFADGALAVIIFFRSKKLGINLKRKATNTAR